MEKGFAERRLENFRSRLAEKGIQAALLTKRESYIYMSGFTGTSAYLLITQDQAVLVTDFRYTEQATAQAPLYRVVQYSGSLMAALNDLLKEMKVSVLGFEESDVSYERYLEFKEKLAIGEFVPLGGIVEKLRLVKDTDEIEIMQRAVDIADEAYAHILEYIRPGVAEIEIAAEMEYFMKRQGASGASFDIIVASGKRSSMPHGVASEKKIELGDAVTLDYGALYHNYCSDITRTVFVGEPDPELKRIYGIVLEAQMKSLDGAHRGLTGREVDDIARSLIAGYGFGRNFGHGLGHGVGLEIHEEPRFSPSGNTAMENGMVITVEPGIYVPGQGGVRIEDIIVINDEKPHILTHATKELIIL